MVRLTTGKMSTREGTVIKVEDLLKESISRVQKVIEEKNPNMENRDEEASKIGIGAVIFNTLSTTLIKDQVFDWDQVLNFQGTYLKSMCEVRVLYLIKHCPFIFTDGHTIIALKNATDIVCIIIAHL